MTKVRRFRPSPRVCESETILCGTLSDAVGSLSLRPLHQPRIINDRGATMNPLRVGFLGFEGVMALDLVGPIDAFTNAVAEDSKGQTASCYEVVVIGLTNRPFTSESGVVFKPHKTITNAPALDTLIIPGGKGLRVPDTQRKTAEWISRRAAKTRRIATVCTGTFGLAATGLLNGRRVTTHWRQAQELSKTFPQLDRKSTRLNSSHQIISYAVFCLKKKKKKRRDKLKKDKNNNIYITKKKEKLQKHIKRKLSMFKKQQKKRIHKTA